MSERQSANRKMLCSGAIIFVARFACVLSLLIPIGAVATGYKANACAELLDSQHASSIHGEPQWATRFNLTTSERAKIQSLFGGANTSSHIVEAAFVKYVDFTLQKLKPEFRDKILELMKNEEILLDHSIDTYRGEMSEGLKVRIEGPIVYQGTVTLATTRVHELQHLINFVSADADLRKAIGMSRFSPWVEILSDFRLKQQYFDEYAAIRAEWEFLSLFPKRIRIQEIELVSQANVEKRIQNSQIRRLVNSSLSWEEYIQGEHATGRHSLYKFRKDIWLLRATLALPTFIFLESIWHIFS